MKHIFVVNPAAGKGKNIPALLASISYACEDLKVDYDIYHTHAAGDATVYVSEKCKQNPDQHFRFYACGGDGTLSEVVNGVVGNDNAEIAVIPAGTGNDFIRTFRHPEYFSAIQKQILGTAKKIDVLKYNDRYSLNIINVGFDCDVVQKVGEIKRNAFVPSKLAYIMGIVAVFAKPLGKKFKVTIDDGEPIENKFMLCAMANALYYGGGFKAAPLAKLNDGYMDLCLVDVVSRLDFIRIIPKYKAGEHVDENGNSKYPFVRYRKCKKVVIESEDTIGISGDGEVSPINKVLVEVIPNAIAFSIPEDSGCESLDPAASR
jgi:YegS/Rv2252/BmrU family lipid kinase